MSDQKKATAIKKQYEQQWLAIAEVAAIGIGRVDDQVGILVSVAANPEKVRKEIPDRIEGIPIRIQHTGAFKAQ